jgi:hypothetical protein
MSDDAAAAACAADATAADAAGYHRCAASTFAFTRHNVSDTAAAAARVR